MALDANGAYYPVIPDVSYPASTRGTLRHGSGAPADSFGSDGDVYVNITNGDVYTKTGDTWVLQVGSVGVANQVAVGSPVGTVTPGAIGQFYSDITTAGQPIVYQAIGATSADWVQLI